MASMDHSQGLLGKRHTVLVLWRFSARLMLPAIALVIGYLRLAYCLDSPSQAVLSYRWYTYACMSDISSLFSSRGMAFPAIPYRDYQFEYPVGTGTFAYVCAVLAALVNRSGISTNPTLSYFGVTAVLLTLCGLATVWWTRAMPGARRGDVIFLALGMLCTAFLNWDLLTVALTAAALYAWSRDDPGLCGVLLGCGAASKAYPALLLFPLLLVCLRERRLKVFIRTAALTLLVWVGFNLPYLSGPMRNGWALFFTFNRQRAAGYGSVWFLVERILSVNWTAERLNVVSGVAFFACALGIWLLGRYAPRPPQLGELAFLTIAAFLLTSKVWSAQYELWLLPLAVLTRLSRPLLYSWLITETAYFVALCWYFNGLAGGAGPVISESVFLGALGMRWVLSAVLCVLIVRRTCCANRHGVPHPATACYPGPPVG